MKAIYEIIKEALTSEGRLPDGFELLNGELAPNEIHWVAGAMDGVGIFHMGKQDVEKAAARIAKLLVKNDTAKIPAIVKKHGVLHLIDQVLSEVRANAESVDAQSLIRYAMGLAFDGSDVELVKLGIAIIGLFDWSDNPEVQERLVTLGLYDEFTLYVLVAAQQWDNENEIIFRLAKSVDGWGKIHAVERLKPETAEIRDWILRHGCENAVMDAYLGLECANKGGLIEALRQDEIDDELFGTICVLMDALFDEGPVPGISEYEHAAEAVRLYLRHALNHAAALKHLWHILNVPADSEEGFRIPEEAKKTRSEILARESCTPSSLKPSASPMIRISSTLLMRAAGLAWIFRSSCFPL